MKATIFEKLKLIDHITFELKITKADFVERLKKRIDKESSLIDFFL
jgi:hypothetical protein